jgi:hypothetical protein
LLGILSRLVINGHFGPVRPGSSEAREPLPREERAGASVRASNSERGS